MLGFLVLILAIVLGFGVSHWFFLLLALSVAGTVAAEWNRK